MRLRTQKGRKQQPRKHPNIKRPLHSSQVRMPGTGVVTVMMWLPQKGHMVCIGMEVVTLGTPVNMLVWITGVTWVYTRYGWDDPCAPV